VLKKVTNTSSLIPEKGWIVIWNANVGSGYGHIAIILEANVNSFVSLDQNWSSKAATKVTHNYTNVYGFLAPLQTTQETMTYTEEEMTKVRLERDSNWTKYQTELENVKKLTSENKGLKEERDSIKKKYNSLIEYIFSKINPLKPLIDQSEDSAKAEIVSLVSNIDILNKEIKDTQNEANDKETKLIKENEVLQGKLDTLQTQFDKLKENHASELEAMQAKIDKVQAQVDANSKTKQENNTIMTWIENIIKKLKG
jgi:chromosome segregation ATPase